MQPSKTVSTKVIITFLSLILTLNNFTFNFTYYLQVMRCEMDTICTPAHANSFMAQFEVEHNIPLHSWQSSTISNIHRRYFYDLEWN